MATAAPAAPPPARPKGLRLLRAALRNRKSATMLVFGFSSGLPFALLIGTLNAWLGEAKIALATIGVLSWIGLAYAFKFLWSPLVDRVALPGLSRLGRRKGWIVLCQALLVAAFAALAATDPHAHLGWFAIWAVIGALASATQDVAIDAWRIDVADEAAPVDLLSTIYQLGFRVASLVGGALALVLAARMPWHLVYLLMAGLLALAALVTLAAPDTPAPSREGEAATLTAPPRWRAAALAVVGAGWVWALAEIGGFMIRALGAPPAGGKPPSASAFIAAYGPWIVVATVLVPLAVAAVMNRAAARRAESAAGGRALDHLYLALIAPLGELAARMRWGVLIVFGLILTYRLCDTVWAAFALPFYLDFLKYSNDEVAFASKIFGVLMTIGGISLGGVMLATVGRFPTLLLGAAATGLGNLLFADLAAGGAGIDAFAHATGLAALAHAAGSDPRMLRLMLAISGENIAGGIAGAAFVAYLSSIVSTRYTAVQYALLSSLTFLIGSLGRGMAGEAFDRYGYATVFHWTAMLALPAMLFVALEWGRTRAAARVAAPERAPT